MITSKMTTTTEWAMQFTVIWRTPRSGVIRRALKTGRDSAKADYWRHKWQQPEMPGHQLWKGMC